MVDILRKFVREERFGNWALHIDAVSEMLRYLAASGHNPYTKSAYLCVHRMSKLKDERQDMMGCDLHPDSTNTDVCSVDNFTPSCQEGSEWQLIFKGVAGTGIKLYDLWTNTTWGEDLGCHGNYRNKALYDAWNDRKLNVKQVKLSLYDDTGVKVKLVFKGTDSDILSWFAKERLVSSLWSDLTTTATTNYFSIDGDVTSILLIDRRFFINMNYGGCDIDRGWMVVVDSEGPCSWEKSFSSYPAIMYSTNYTSTTFNDARNDKILGIADYLTIHIDTE
ncbi:uncharacterized protein LOC117289152 [Asterias rubens]|uniref:uncharacterized protein LOC117289152 n=1 Tax=Asterias rubens TaxID=7604 RepID=UPI0014554C1F|nr:uncharacterized protein LOC117289152 [Asterias rubens]